MNEEAAEGVDGRSVPFFIMGCPRSGTTLVAQLLDSHSRLAVYLETNYYLFFRPIARMYGDLRSVGLRRRFITDVLDGIRMQRTEPPSLDEFEQALVAPTFEGVLATLLQLYARQQGKVRGGEKTPLHYKYLTDILAGFPESPVVFLIRDPRDVVLSMRKAWSMSIRQATQAWNEAFLRQSEVPASSIHVVRYEDLVRDPTGEGERVCKTLGESFEPNMLQFFGRIPDHLKAIRHLDLAKLSGPVVASSIGNYKEMTKDEIREIEVACGMGMEAMNYEFTAPAPEITVPVIRPRGFLRLVFDRARYYGWNAERWRRGMFRWRVALMVRLRYFFTLGFLRGAR